MKPVEHKVECFSTNWKRNVIHLLQCLSRNSVTRDVYDVI